MKVSNIIDKMKPTVSESMLARTGTRRFIEKYSSMNTEDVDWIDVCHDAETYVCFKFGLLLIIQLLEMGLYKGSHATKLYQNLSIYQKTFNHGVTLRSVMCGDKIESQIIYQDPYEKSPAIFSFRYIDTDNPTIIELFKQYLSSVDNSRLFPLKIIECFGKSLGKYESEIHSATDFTSTTMFEQTNYYKSYFENDERMRKNSISIVINFYRWLVYNNSDHNYFATDFHMSEALLFSYNFPTLIEQGYYFIVLNPANVPLGKERICFILRGFNNESTMLTNEDHVVIDFSGLTSSFYRDLLIEFITTSSTISSIQWVGIPLYIIETMEKLYQAKLDSSYPNQKLEYLNNQEAIFIRQIIEHQNISIGTKNNKIGAVRRFINFCVDKKSIKVDDLFFDYLVQYEEPNINTAKAVPDEDLKKLGEYLSEKSDENLINKEVYVVFHLQIQTEFRINQICHLQTDCIKQTMNSDQFAIASISKTSHGKINKYVITSTTYHLLMDIIEETEKIRETCPVSSMKKYIFVYNRSQKDTKPMILNNSVYNMHLAKACSELGIPRYNASNLRDTHMTKALEHIIKNGKSEWEMSVLSKHKHIDTTKNHYIDMELNKMLEATHGIIIGSNLIETDSKVIDDIPEDLKGTDNDVENGCGKCTAERCVITTSLPCLVCKHFITTPKHKIYFEKAIENVDRLIKQADNRHDKEDLVTIKTLYVLYLKAIIKHSEG